MATKRQRPKHLEDLAQKAVMDWAVVQRMPSRPGIKPGSVVADYLYAIPNGGQRGGAKNRNGIAIEAARMKGLGVKAGVSDLHLPVPVDGCPGLWIEMKKQREAFRSEAEARRAVSPQQAEWLQRMASLGFETAVCYGGQEAIDVIAGYLGLPSPFGASRGA